MTGARKQAGPMSAWRDEIEEINRKALARFNKALPAVFPSPVLTHALERRFTPPMPRLAVDSYWRAHPVRADRLARALAAKTGAPDGWTWRLADAEPRRKKGRQRKSDLEPDWLAASFRVPPAPYRERGHARGPGFCCICGQPVYRFGWHVDLWDRGANRNAAWHAACVVAWDLWTAPSDYAGILKRLQQRRCAETGGRLWKTAEVDHRVPLFRVWRECRDTAWPSLLGFWGVPNLQVINRDAHVGKCAEEARQRSAGAALPAGEQGVTRPRGAFS
jgi:hypothetical protein